MKNNNDFTYDSDKFGKLPEFVKHLHEVNKEEEDYKQIYLR